jgi:hypothetical protein
MTYHLFAPVTFALGYFDISGFFPLLEKLAIALMVKEFPSSFEHEGSLPFTQDPAWSTSL